MTQKKNKSDDQQPDISDVGRSQFQLGPFIAVMLLVLGIGLMLWKTFQVPDNNVQQPAVQQTAPSSASSEPQRPLRRGEFR